MNTPKIDALDLRPPQQPDPWDSAWDFPSVSVRMQEFMAGAPWTGFQSLPTWMQYNPAHVRTYASFAFAAEQLTREKFGMSVQDTVEMYRKQQRKHSFERADDLLTKFIKRAFRRPVIV